MKKTLVPKQKWFYCLLGSISSTRTLESKSEYFKTSITYIWDDLSYKLHFPPKSAESHERFKKILSFCGIRVVVVEKSIFVVEKRLSYGKYLFLIENAMGQKLSKSLNY